MDNEKIKQVVYLAKEYIKQGHNNVEAIKLANEEISNIERDKYEK